MNPKSRRVVMEIGGCLAGVFIGFDMPQDWPLSLRVIIAVLIAVIVLKVIDCSYKTTET